MFSQNNITSSLAKTNISEVNSSNTNKIFDIADLSELVKGNNFAGIKEVIARAKKAKEWEWKYSKEDFIEVAIRDAILLGRIEIVKLFLDEGVNVNLFAPLREKGGCNSTINSFCSYFR